ncbi:MAG: hypothetical protein WCK67_01120 [bacterium]
MTKKKLFCFLLIIVFSFQGAFCDAKSAKQKNNPEIILPEVQKTLTPEEYKKIYDDLPILDINYLNNEDPDETMEYYRSIIYSPYPLIRISNVLNCRTIKLAVGEYLLKPSNYNSYDFVMFKQNGKLIGLVPVFKKQFVGRELVARKEVKKNYTKRQKRMLLVKKVLKFPFMPILKPKPFNKFAIEVSYSPAKEYMIMDFYFKDTLYKMLFKLDKPNR